ncbi:MAG: DUF2336 domain-containing protein [Methyloligellaceae bacterium]
MADARGLLLALDTLTSEKSGGNASALLDRVTDLFFATSESQSEADSAVFGDVIERIAYEVEVEARAQLAKRLAPAEKAPLSLIRGLAKDEIIVARPVLEQSPRLTDHDLVQIARSLGQDHLHAIASRDTLSSKVTDVIVERGDDHVLTQVASNDGAHFSFRGIEHLSDRAKSSDALMSALSSRADIPENLIDEVKRNVSTRLKSELLASNPEMDSEQVDSLVNAQADSIDVESYKASNDKLLKLHQAGELKEYMLVYFARERRLAETVRCLALLTGLEDSLVSRCLLKADIAALGILCKASGFQNKTYSSLLQIRTTTNRLNGRAIADAMRTYDSLTTQAARSAIEHVRSQATTN